MKSVRKIAERYFRKLEKKNKRHYELPAYLRGQCFRVSKEFGRILKEEGFKPLLICGDFITDNDHSEPHYWLQIGKRIVDLTQLQFQSQVKHRKLKPIFIGYLKAHPEYVIVDAPEKI
jgi:hypothetical protein